MVVAKWCKCLNVKLSLHNPPTPVTNTKWIQENTSMRKCGESKVQGNVVTMELEKMVHTRMVSGWQVWKCFNCNVDICAIDMNNAVAVVNMELQDSDDISQMPLGETRSYSDCFRVIIDPASETDSSSATMDNPQAIEHFNFLQNHVDEFMGVEEKFMEKRIRAFIKEQNETLSKLRTKVNAERTIIWKKMCSAAASNPTPSPAVPSSTSSASASSTTMSTTAPTQNTGRGPSGSVSRPHSRSVSGASAVAPVLGFRLPGQATPPVTEPATTSAASTTAQVPTVPAVVEVTEQPTVTTAPRSRDRSQAITAAWQAAPRPAPGVETKLPAPETKMPAPETKIPTNTQKKRAASPDIFAFDDEEPDYPVEPEVESDEEEEIDVPVVESAPPPKPVLDSSHLLGSSVPVPIPTRTRAATTTSAHTTYNALNTSASFKKPQATTPTTALAAAGLPPGSPSRGGVSTTATSVAMTTVSATAPTSYFHTGAARASPAAAPSQLSSSASQADDDEQVMVPRQSWRQNFLGEEVEESIPPEMAASFVVPLSLNRRLKSLI